MLLPADADRSARRIQTAVSAAVGGRVGVIVTDTHGRAFRRGLVDVALGVAGFEAINDCRGEVDRDGRVLVATELAVADELAAAAGILMGKAAGTPVVVVSGVATTPAPGTVGGSAAQARTRPFSLNRARPWPMGAANIECQGHGRTPRRRTRT